jgi:peptidoglycan/LPS O-acetylase OafA/YrhL
VALANYVHNLPSFLTYTSNWFVDPWAAGLVVFVPAWSLATEEQFYLFWPWIVALTKSVRTPILVMSSLIAGSQAVKVVYGYKFFLTSVPFAFIVLNSVSVAICCGCLLALAFDNRRAYDLSRRILGAPWSAPVFFAAMLVASCIPNEDILHVSHMSVVIGSMTLAVGALTIQRTTALSMLLTNRRVRYIGTISYGLYLYHSFGLNIAEVALGGLKSIPALYYVSIIAINVMIASASYYLFERWFLRLKDRLTRRTEPVGEPALQPAA